MFVLKYINYIWAGCKKIFINLKFVFLLHRLRVEPLQNIENKKKTEVNLHIVPHLTSNAAAAKRFVSHVEGFLDLPLIKDSVNNLYLCWRTSSFTYFFARVLKSCKKTLRYLIYNRCLLKFTQNSAKFLTTAKKIIFVKVSSSSLQIYGIINSFRDIINSFILGKYEFEHFKYNFTS